MAERVIRNFTLAVDHFMAVAVRDSAEAFACFERAFTLNGRFPQAPLIGHCASPFQHELGTLHEGLQERAYLGLRGVSEDDPEAISR
jgi:hypothetical protein